MDSESPLIPVSERPAEQRVAMHLRYFALLRENRDFRHLWMAQLVSELGDWFYSLAIYDLLLKVTGSGQAVGFAIIIQLLPWFFMTPVAGFLADRFPRRHLMIVADIVRGVVVLGLLLVRTTGDIWLVYALLGVEVIFASIFEPARNALLPNLTRPAELLPANALSSATWSFALTIGAALGGAVTALLGRDVAFVVNSLSFFGSALLLQRIRVVEHHAVAPPPEPAHEPGHPSLRSLRGGAEYFRQNPKVTVVVLAKMGLGWVGGILLLLAVFGEQIFPLHGRGALAMGLLYAARGAGAGIGPMIGDHVTRGIENRMWRSISISFFIMGASYLLFSGAPNLPLAALAVFVAHMGGSNIWVISTTLIQMHVDDRFRGRVFAVDFGLNMLAAAASNYVMGLGLDRWGLSARQLAAGLGAVLLIPALLWLPAQAKWGKESSD
jgi:MFS family permease